MFIHTDTYYTKKQGEETQVLMHVNVLQFRGNSNPMRYGTPFLLVFGNTY